MRLTRYVNLSVHCGPRPGCTARHSPVIGALLRVSFMGRPFPHFRPRRDSYVSPPRRWEGTASA